MSILRYILRRVILAAVTLFVILSVSYTLLRLAPGDPTRSSVIGGDAGAQTVTDAGKGGLAVNRAMREKLHLDEPIVYGFALWLRQVVLHGDFGESAAVEPGRSVASLIAERLPVTVSLNVAAILLTYMAAISLGLYQASRPSSVADRVIGMALFGLYSLPVMWVGLLLQSLLCEGGVWQVLPLKPFSLTEHLEMNIWEVEWQLFKSYLLPVLCLAYGGMAGLACYSRDAMLDALHGDYVRTARAKGLGRLGVTLHAFRNALIPLITLFGGLLPSLVSGSVIVEYIFNLPGMGTLALSGLSSRDYPLQMALFAFTGALTLSGLLMSDLLYTVCDPRIRLDK